MDIVVASGKGGTGKTTVAVNLALVLQEQAMVRLLDCDVEEPNAHIFIKPHLSVSRLVGIPVPLVDEAICSFCGRCAEICAFNALAVLKDKVLLFHELCHGCGACAFLCPEKAITESERPIGVLESGSAGDLAFVHGRLNPGEAISPPLINAVKQAATSDAVNIIDAPPGTSCPVVAAVKGAHFCLLVTEPTPFGLNDLDLAVQMVHKLGVPAGVVINRCDIGDGRVEEYCREHGVPVLLKLPWDRQLAALYARGEPAAPVLPEWRRSFAELYDRIMEQVKAGEQR